MSTQYVLESTEPLGHPLAHGSCLIIFDTLLTPSSRFLLSSQQEDETTVIKEDNDQCQPVGLAWYLLWCHILVYNGLWSMPKSTHSRQLSDRLPFIRMTSLCYLITFHRLFQVWGFSPMNLKSSLGPLHHQSQNKDAHIGDPHCLAHVKL